MNDRPIYPGAQHDGSAPHADGTPWHQHYPDQLKFLHYTLTDEWDPSNGRVGFVYTDSDGHGALIGCVFYNQQSQKFWGLLTDKIKTAQVDNPTQALEAVVTLTRSKQVTKTLVDKAFAKTANYKAAYERAWDRVQKLGGANGRSKALAEATSEYEGAIGVLGTILLETGANVAGYNLSMPSHDDTRKLLAEWIEKRAGNTSE